jgi:hypothetical protein
MKVQRFVPLALVFCVGIASGCRLSLGKTGLFGSKKPKAVKAAGSQITATSPPQSQTKDRVVTDKEYVAYRQSILQKFENDEFEWMNTHKRAWPRLLAGFRSIEKLYGVAPHRLNEACFFAFGAGDHRTALELFNRIGEDYDKTVWRSKTNFEVFRRGASIRDKAEREKQKAAQSVSKIG